MVGNRLTGKVVVGVDCGASKTEVLAVSDSDELTFVRQVGINYQRLGLGKSIQRLVDVFEEIKPHIDDASSLVACVGLAGADTSEDRNLLTSRLETALGGGQGRPPDWKILVVQDSIAALEAAFPRGSGSVVIIGTGSIAIAKTVEGEILRTGGWGYLLGDEGGGYRIGLSALRRLSVAMDNNVLTEFDNALLEIIGASNRSDLIHWVYHESALIQTVAPLVIECSERGDAVARRILESQAAAVADCFGRLVKRVSDRVEKKYVLTGGLSESEHYRSLVQKAIAEVAEGWVSSVPVHPKPVFGALSLARSM